MNTHDTVALEIPLDQIEPSPFQYRRTINESRLAELAAKHYGVEAAPASAKVTTKAARASKKAAATEESAQA